MFGNRLIKSNNAGAACTTDTVQILDGETLESIATYQLDGAATSIPNNTYPGAWVGSASYTTGKFGQAALFNGTSSGINLPSSTPISNQINGTVSLWFNVLNNTKKETLIRFANNDEVLFRINTNGTLDLIGVRQSNNSYISYTTTGSYNDGAWHHLVMTRESGSIKFYINNSLDNTLSWNNTFVTAANESAIGWDGFSTASILSGKIDQVRIFNTALSAEAVTSLYNETVATASNSYINIPSCIAYYKMSDATDETGSYDGTPSNVNFNVAGKFGNAGEFNGSSSYITLPVTQPNDISISAWIKIEDLTRQHQIVSYDTGGAAPDRCLQFRVESNQTVSAYWFSGTKAQSTSSVSQGVWAHVVATWEDNGTQKIYFNGVLEDSKAATTRLPFPNLYMGGRDTLSLPDDFLGSIDQVRIFNRAITANEVETLYDEVQCIPTIVPTDYFNTVLWTGNEVSGRQITGVGFQPDFVWIKDRGDGTHWHNLFDSVRGASERLFSNTTTAESFYNESLQSFNSDGFTVGLDPDVNRNGGGIVAWNFKAGGPDVLNQEGTIDSQVSANVEAGFSIVAFNKTTNGATASTFGHGLSAVPEMIILKRTDATDDWYVYHKDLGNTIRISLNTTAAQVTGTSLWGSTSPTDSVFTLLGYNAGNAIAYCFHSVDGYQKVGSYTGTGAAGNNIVTGFRPAFVMVKRASAGATTGWFMLDNKRSTGSVWDERLQADTSAAEAGPDSYTITTSSNGFELTGSFATFSGSNASGATYIFMAFAEEVFVPDNFFNDDSTVATYKLDGDAGDDSGNGYNGIASNVTYAAGKFDEAAVFNGSNSKIDVSNFSYANSTFSISLWVNFNSIATAGSGVTTVLMGTFNGTNTNVGNIWVDSEKMRIHSNQKYADVTYSFNTNQWYQIGIVFETNGDFFGIVNGSRITPTNVNSYSGTNNGIRIGPTLNGKIDQVRIFNRALDSGEVTQLYNE